MRRNGQAASLAALAGVLLLLTGFNGARGVNHFFLLLTDWLGPNPILFGLAFVFVAIASLGGVAVLLGGYLIYRDQVRTGRLFIILGSGAGLFTLVMFLVVNLRREAFSFLLHVLPALAGVALGIAARMRSKPKRLL